MLSLDSGTEWVRRAPLPVARGHVGIVALAEKVYVLGGTLSHHPRFVDTDLVHVYDSKKDEWHAASSLPSARSHFEPGTFTVNGRIYVVGGRDNESKRLAESEMADITVYDPSVDAWSELRSLPYPLRAPVAQVIGGSLIVTNGSTFMAEEPQTATLTVPCGPPGSLCNPEGVEAFQLRFRGKLKAAFKSLAHHIPFRVQDLIGFSHFVREPTRSRSAQRSRSE
jgi:N-acetylneuraminic acid mutarotase